MAAKIPAFGDIGKNTRELLYGGKVGTFQYNKLLNIETRTADGVTFAVSALKKDANVETALKASWKNKLYGITAGFNAAGKLTSSIQFLEIAPGLSASLTGTLPDISTAKLGVDYIAPYVNLKSTVGLSQAPKAEVAVTTGYKDFTLGGLVGYDSAKSEVTAWTLIAGLTRADYQGAIVVTDKADTLKFLYAHNLDSRTAVGAEVLKKLAAEKTTFTVGYSKVLEGGALTKVRLDTDGIASLLYEQDLTPLSRLSLSSQFDATDLNQQPKFGIALNLKN